MLAWTIEDVQSLIEVGNRTPTLPVSFLTFLPLFFQRQEATLLQLVSTSNFPFPFPLTEP